MVHAVGVAVLRQYPAPPSDGLVVEPSSKVTAMLDMWLQYKAGEARLADTATFCQTALEKGRQRSAAAKKYGIELPVLTTLGELAAEKGGSHARKHKGYNKPYTEIERAWLDAVLKKLIRRAAQVAHDPRANRPLITMADPDLPRL